MKLLQEILIQLEGWYEGLKTDGFQPAIQKWKQLSATLGQRIRIGEVTGEAVDLDEHGGLVIRNDQGERITRMSGDVVKV